MVCILGLLGNCLTVLVLAQYQACTVYCTWHMCLQITNISLYTDSLNILQATDRTCYHWFSSPPGVSTGLWSTVSLRAALVVPVPGAVCSSYQGTFFRTKHLLNIFVQHITITGSIYGVVIIALERHHVIHHPLRSTPTFSVCSTFLILFSISVNLPKFLEFKVLINLTSTQSYDLSNCI